MTKKLLAIIVVIIALVALTVYFIFSKNKDDIKTSKQENREAEITDIQDATLEQIEKKAKTEGAFELAYMSQYVIDMEPVLNGFSDKYGINCNNVYSDSLMDFSKSKTKAMGIADFSVAKRAAEQGILQPYKTSNFDSVPDWAKDENGFWISAFSGCISFIRGNKSIPFSWEEIRNGDYIITVGDASKSVTAQSTVIASAYAFGGSMDDLEPAFEFWIEMAEKDRIDSGDILMARVDSGEIELGVTWSYESVFYKNSSENSSICIGIPSDGTILIGNALVINKNTNTLFSSALFCEYVFSDEGQMALAKIGAIPARTDLKVSPEIEEDTFKASEYKNAVVITDFEKYIAACDEISKWWNENIIPKLN